MSIKVWALATAIFGTATLILAVVAIRKRLMMPFWAALGFLVLTVVCVLFALYATLGRVGSRVKEALKPREGIEIYAALFGEPVGDGVQVTHHRDQIIPKLDPGITLRLRTIPAEMVRILGQLEYTAERIASNNATVYTRHAKDEFAPGVLGDTVLLFYREMEAGRNWRWIYCNKDSTEAIVVDVLD
ncbi:MAG: hypothetical protein JNM62_16475 [Flavobacteriales bacterium]|nr:hypothetical protein [Flavobacteriales bacterium]